MAIIYPLCEVKSDLEMAKKILLDRIDVSYRSQFNAYSFIYKNTNEALTEYVDHFSGKKKMASVIGSGDQIINAILAGVEDIEAFDISRLPKYFLLLKIAAIQALTLEEYIDFFYVDDHYKKSSLKRDLKYHIAFEKICRYLDPLSLEFWSELIRKKNWHNVYNSMIFSDHVLSPNCYEINRYLEKSNFGKIKSTINDSSINIQTGDILDIASTLPERDLVYLSNIFDYVGLNRYIYMLKQLRLTENGEVLSYCFQAPYVDQTKKLFENAGCTCEDLYGGDSLIIYRRKP